jgi:hypothetical protein
MAESPASARLAMPGPRRRLRLHDYANMCILLPLLVVSVWCHPLAGLSRPWGPATPFNCQEKIMTPLETTLEARLSRVRAIYAAFRSDVTAVANACELTVDSMPPLHRPAVQSIADHLRAAIEKAVTGAVVQDKPKKKKKKASPKKPNGNPASQAGVQP